MYNWSTDTTRLKKNTKKHDLFVLEQRINFGLNSKKISLPKLRKYWKKLDIDPNKKAYLKRLI